MATGPLSPALQPLETGESYLFAGFTGLLDSGASYLPTGLAERIDRHHRRSLIDRQCRKLLESRQPGRTHLRRSSHLGLIQIDLIERARSDLQGLDLDVPAQFIR